MDEISTQRVGKRDGKQQIKGQTQMQKRKKLSTLDRVLLFCAFSILIFTITMTVIFCIYQTVPDTLIVSFFGTFTGEGCICWRIWAKKRKINLDN